ncbi:MAG: T9SS type A sorting domain-containing protein [Paludibacter sp.]|nr:T9SS type A sorting domain-containing protein [Paludibacter sp.]
MKTKITFLLFLFALLPFSGQAIGTWQTAVAISNGETKSGTLSDATGQKENWYKISVTENGAISLDITPGAGLNINYISLYTLKDGSASVERKFVYIGTEQKSLTENNVAAGTYYVKILRSSGNGGYTLKYNFTKNSYINDSEPNNAIKTGSLLTSGSTVQGQLGYYYNNADIDTEDWYKIEVPSNGTINLEMIPGSGLNINYISLYTLKDGSASVERKFVYIGTDQKSLTENNVAAGTYYVKILRSSGNGGYTLKYNFTKNSYKNDTEPNNTYQQGQPLTINETVTGHLGYSYHFSDIDNNDWYRLTIKEKGVVNFKIKPDTASSISIDYIELFKITETGTTSKGFVYVKREEKQLTLNDIEPGDYALRVFRLGGAGAYTLTFGQAVPLAGSPIKVDVIGRTSIRRGAPNRFTVKLINTGGERTQSFMLAVGVTEDIHFLGAEVPHNGGVQKLKINEELESANATAQSFFVPYLEPFESYSFDILVEGAATGGSSVNGAKVQQQADILPALVVGAVVSYGTGIVVDKIQDWVQDKVSDGIDLSPQEAQEYARAMNITVEELGMTKQKDGIGVFATKSVIKQTVENASKLNPVTNLIFKVGNAVETTASISQSLRRRLWYWLYSEVGLIDKKIAVSDGKLAADKIVASWDPNEKTGPKGFGETNAIAKPQRMDYTIFFENKKEATAPAYRIYIEDTLSELFDLSTVEFGSTSHSGDNYFWQMEQDGNKLKWTIEGIELPPNITPPEGEGYVTFSVELKPGIASGVPVTNNATIIFDKNAPITTNIWTNVLDMLAPTTQMNSVNYTQGDTDVTVSCISNDNVNGSGVNRYLFYVSENEAPFTFIEESKTNSIKFPINLQKEINYRFYTLAIDNTGNVEQNRPDYVTFNSLTSSVNDVKANKLRAYPNPSMDGIFYITGNTESIHATSYRVYSTIGQLVIMKEISVQDGRQPVKIDLSGYPAGIYHATIEIDKKLYSILLQKK